MFLISIHIYSFTLLSIFLTVIVCKCYFHPEGLDVHCPHPIHKKRGVHWTSFVLSCYCEALLASQAEFSVTLLSGGRSLYILNCCQAIKLILFYCISTACHGLQWTIVSATMIDNLVWFASPSQKHDKQEKAKVVKVACLLSSIHLALHFKQRWLSYLYTCNYIITVHQKNTQNTSYLGWSTFHRLTLYINVRRP